MHNRRHALEAPGNAEPQLGTCEVPGNAEPQLGTCEVPGNAEPQLGTSLPIPERTPVWRSRGYLPHFDTPGALQSITFRLADSLPRTKLAELEKEISTLPPEPASVARRKKIEEWFINHFRAVSDYIHRNPVEAGLCRTAAEWPWSSAGLITMD